jgi:MFS family permease
LPQRHAIGFITIAKTLLGRYPRRSALSFSLFIGQAFLYNAIFFTYAIALTTFYHVATASVGLYLLPFAAGNFAGPLLLGRFFDTLGRKASEKGRGGTRIRGPASPAAGSSSTGRAAAACAQRTCPARKTSKS